MGTRSYEQNFKEKGRITFTVPSVAGNYAEERLTFGSVKSGDTEQSFREFTVLTEGFVSGASVELWLPKIADGTKLAENRTDTDYYNSNTTPLTSAGVGRWQVSGWPGGQIRVKSGGAAGALTISGSSY